MDPNRALVKDFKCVVVKGILFLKFPNIRLLQKCHAFSRRICPTVAMESAKTLQAMSKYNYYPIRDNNVQISLEEGGGSNHVTTTGINILTEGDQSSQPKINNTKRQAPPFMKTPPGIKAPRRAKRSRASSSDSSEFMLEKTSSLIKSFEVRKAKRKLEQDKCNQIMEAFKRLKERELLLEKEIREHRIMELNTECMSPSQEEYWYNRQQEIISLSGCLF